MKKKNILITIIIILVILLISILILLKILNNDSNEYTKKFTDIDEIEINKTLEETSSRNNYYIVKSCINKFYIYYSAIYNANKATSTQEIYNMLDKEYIEARGITQDNLLDKLDGINSSRLRIAKMYECEQSEKISIYFVYGMLRDKKTNEMSEFSIMVKTDRYNKTFSIFLQDYIDEKYSDIKVGETIEFEYLEEIEQNNNNTYSYVSIGEQTYIEDILESFKEDVIYNKQYAYETLNKDYRTKKFPTFEEFEEYVNENIRIISSIELSQYERNTSNDGVQYICEDTNGNYYIINEISAMNYNIILDTYTIDLPQFIEKYEASDDNTKVALNIEKLKEAINANDFKYVYNKMDETFKNNNFKNYSDFENYMKSKLFEKNTFEYKNIVQKSKVYVATVVVSDENNITSETKEIKIIMKLTDTTDYYISFDMGD